jgi:hypothetical protein
MSHAAIAALHKTLSPHVRLGKSRLETLCLLVTGMVSARSVNLSHVACERPGGVQIASTYRRLQRFFQHADLASDWSLPLITGLLGLGGSWHLALDRTQWQIGGRDVNFLVLAVVTPRFRAPLMWSVIDGRGCSNTAQRIALMRRYLAAFDASTIRLLLADREFIGNEWLKFLNDHNVPFAIRLKGKMRVTTGDGHTLSLNARLRLRQRAMTFRARLGAGDPDVLMLNFAAKRLKSGELLIVASNAPAPAALAAYRKRWAIECLFGDAKTRGLNIEDTRLTDPRKLDLLMALAALALAWAARTAVAVLGSGAPRRKAHGWFEKSWFRTGFDQIRRLLRYDPAAAMDPWLRLNSKPSKWARVV